MKTTYKKTIQALLASAFAFGTLFGLSACEQQSPSEEIAEEMEEAAESDDLEEAADEVEEVGEEVEEAVEESVEE
ncbi:MAG: hypothetical protein R3242_06150 [Akkermansiaceae bacterium]|nr:hypothetical protein [Akkermansiaceae bacterium]